MENWLYYTACGLDNVWLANGFIVKTTKYGQNTSIDDIDGLHGLLASCLTEKSGLLSGKEFRLLHVHLGLRNISQKWAMPIRDWNAALTRFTIQFADRISIN